MIITLDDVVNLLQLFGLICSAIWAVVKFCVRYNITFEERPTQTFNELGSLLPAEHSLGYTIGTIYGSGFTK